MSDGKIYITISDRRYGDPRPETPNTANDNKNDKKDSLLGDWAKHQFFEFAKQQTIQTVQYSISNIGNFTGNYNVQEDIQKNISALNNLRGLATSIAVAGATMGPWGAVIAGAISISTMTINRIKSDYATNFAISKQNREIDILRERSGLDSTKNGSRGTEN